MSVRELFDSLLHRGFKATFKLEPRYEFKTQDQKDEHATDLAFMKYDQKIAKSMLDSNMITEHQLAEYNRCVPTEYRVDSTMSWGDFIERLTKLANDRSVLTKYNDVSDVYIKMSEARETLWKVSRDTDPLTNNAAQSAYKLQDEAAGPSKVSPIDFRKNEYLISYLISLLQCIILSRSIKDGLIEVEDRFTALAYLLGFGSGGFRANVEFDKPSIFYQPRRAVQYDVLKQFDHLFQTVDTQSYSLLFSQLMIPMILCYLYFVVGHIFQTQGVHAQFLLLLVEFKVIQETMLALKFVFRFNISLNVSHFIRTIAGEMHDCKMELFWFVIPGLTTIVLFVAYLLNLLKYAYFWLRFSSTRFGRSLEQCGAQVQGYVAGNVV